MNSLIPERIAEALEGRYRLNRRLGEGGMATVFVAEDLNDRKVAIIVSRDASSLDLVLNRRAPVR